jgi:uncharacterized coiled-coil protein SlyX
VCGLEETLDTETLEELSEIVKKYKMSADSYTYLLNKMRGKCLDSDEHSFIFDEEFTKQIQDIVDKDKLNREEIEKIQKEFGSLVKDIKIFEEKIKEAKMKNSLNKDTLQSLYDSLLNNENEMKKITGNANIDIWR